VSKKQPPTKPKARMQLAKYLLETASKNYGTYSPTCQKAKTARSQMQYTNCWMEYIYLFSA
jgi:hypothetical protein